MWKLVGKAIQINGVTWIFSDQRLHFVSPGHDHFNGATDLNNRLIYVQDYLPKEKTEEILIHELAHASVASGNHPELASNEEYVRKYEKAAYEFLERLAEELLR